MTHLRHTIAIVLCGLALPATFALAQDACPATATCYEGHELEFSAADGPVQFLVVKTDATVTTTLDGQTTSETATLVEFALQGDTFEQRGEPLTYGKAGVLKTADVGDTFSLTEVAP